MPVFTIDGIRYEAERYIDAANLHRQRKAELQKAQISSVSAPRAVTSTPVVTRKAPLLVSPSTPSPSSPLVSPRSSVVSSSSLDVSSGSSDSASVASSGVQQVLPADLSCYRGEKSEWWPDPSIRLMFGMTIREPWEHASMTELFRALQAQIRTSSRGNVAAFAQFLRAEGKPWALATARTGEGSYTSDYNYTITIKNARTFYWINGGIAKAPTIGAPANFTRPEQVDADYIVLNADTIEASTVLGFGHKTATFEVTFFHDMPLDLVAQVNGKPTSEVARKAWSDLSFDEKIKYAKLKR